MNEKTKKSPVKTVLGILWWVFLILLVLVLVRVIGAKMRGEVPTVGGYAVMRVVSGSMEPKIPVGMYILVQSCDPADVAAGDVISFYSDEQTIQGLPNTHRVNVVKDDGDGTLSYETQGDANAIPDKVDARGERLIGKYVCNLTALSAFADMLGGGGMFFVILLLWVGIAVCVIFSLVKKTGDKESSETPPPQTEEP